MDASNDLLDLQQRRTNHEDDKRNTHKIATHNKSRLPGDITDDTLMIMEKESIRSKILDW